MVFLDDFMHNPWKTRKVNQEFNQPGNSLLVISSHIQ